MMLRALVAAALLGTTSLANAASWNAAPGEIFKPAGGGGGYTGPLDIVAAPGAWFSTRAGSAAIAATGTQPAFDLLRISDSSTCTPVYATTGDMDMTGGTPCAGATFGAWMLREVVTGTISGTTLSTTGDACTATTGDTINDGGSHINEYTDIIGITSCSSGSGNGVYTISRSYTISTPETININRSVRVEQWYTQNGGSNQVRSAGVPLFALGITPSGRPAVCNTATSVGQLLGTVSSAVTLSYSAVAIRSGSGLNTIFGQYNGGSELGLRWNGANTLDIYDGGSATATASDGVWHTFNGAPGSPGFIRVDATETSTTTGTPPASTVFDVGSISVGQLMQGCISETGPYPTAFTSGGGGTAALLAANQKAYYGTP